MSWLIWGLHHSFSPSFPYSQSQCLWERFFIFSTCIITLISGNYIYTYCIWILLFPLCPPLWTGKGFLISKSHSRQWPSKVCRALKSREGESGEVCCHLMPGIVQRAKAWRQAMGYVGKDSLTCRAAFLEAVDIYYEKLSHTNHPRGQEALHSTLAPLSPFEDPLLFQ